MGYALKIVIPVAIVLFLFFYASNDFKLESTLVPTMMITIVTGCIVAYVVARVFKQKR